MYCYFCEKDPEAGGTRFATRQAVGVCHECGVGVCLEHAIKSAAQPLLCPECAAARRAPAAESVRHQAA